MQNPYEVLGVSEGCDEETLKKAYRAKCFEYHPDRQNGKTDEEKATAENKFKQVQNAYNSINDGSYEASKNQHHGFNFGNIADMFAQFMGRGVMRQQKQEKPKQVEVEINEPILLSFKEAVQGCKRNIDLNFNLTCFDCMGRCAVPTNRKCNECNGSGAQVKKSSNGFFQQMIQTACEYCGGMGVEIENCKSCNGSGSTTQHLKEEIEVQANAPSGRKISRNVQDVEVIYIVRTTIDIPKDFYLSPNKQHLMKDVKVSIYDFLLGGEKELNLHDGEENLVFQFTTSQNEVVIEDKGLPKNGKRGLLKINIIPEFPQSITEEQRELLNKIKQNNL
jgi:molecular chaperone DnaJ